MVCHIALYDETSASVLVYGHFDRSIWTRTNVAYVALFFLVSYAHSLLTNTLVVLPAFFVFIRSYKNYSSSSDASDDDLTTG